MTVETKRTCDQCALPINPDAPYISVKVATTGQAAAVRELDFHSYAHLIAWAQTQPEPV